MSKTKIILASTLSVLAVASVTTAAVVVTQKRKKENDNPKKGNEGNQVVVAADSKFEYDLNAEQTKELSAKLLLVKGKDVTVTLTENNASKTIKTKVKEDGTVDFSSPKDGKTYTVTKIVVKEGEKDRDLIAEVKAHNEDSGQGKGPEVGGADAGTNGSQGSGTEGGAQAGNTQAGNTDASGSAAGNGQAGGTEVGSADAGTTGSQGSGTGGGAQAGSAHADEKEAEIKKITIVQQQYDKNTGYINFWFKTTKENFEKMRTKSWKMEFDLGGNWTNIETDAAKTGTSGNENVAIVSNLNDGVVVFMSTNYYYNNATNAPQTTYKLINLYYDNNKSNNVLSGPSKDIQVKYE